MQRRRHRHRSLLTSRGTRRADARGLALDLVGTVVVAKGFMFKNPPAAHYESLMIVGSNPFLLKSSNLQRGEACVGAALGVNVNSVAH